MVYLQNWNKNTFEYKYLNRINLKYDKGLVYLGFDYGYFKGINIYYKDEAYKEKAILLKEKLEKDKIFVRLCTNLFTEYDYIILLGYSNLFKERLKLRFHMRKIYKALSSF